MASNKITGKKCRKSHNFGKQKVTILASKKSQLIYGSWFGLGFKFCREMFLNWVGQGIYWVNTFGLTFIFFLHFFSVTFFPVTFFCLASHNQWITKTLKNVHDS